MTAYFTRHKYCKYLQEMIATEIGRCIYMTPFILLYTCTLHHLPDIHIGLGMHFIITTGMTVELYVSN